VAVPPPNVDDDAWIIFTSGSTGCPRALRSPPRGGRLRRCRGATVRSPRAAGSRRPGARRAVGRLRRLVRGDVARLASRCVSRPGPTIARALRRGSRTMAAAPGHHGRLHGAHPGRDVAGGVHRERAPAHLRRRGVPARARRAPGRRGTRGVEHVRPHRGDRRGVRGPLDGSGRCASACRWTGGRLRWSTATDSRSAREASAS
jgi:hypothetical protein